MGNRAPRQFFDVCVFLVVLNLVYMIHRQYKNTYQEADDLHGIYWVVPPCLLLGIIFHPHLNRSAADVCLFVCL